MVDTHSFIPPMHNAKAKEIKVVDLAENDSRRGNMNRMTNHRFVKSPGGNRIVSSESYDVTTPDRVEVDEWDCPFCKATVYETDDCECGAQLRIHAIKRL